MSYDTAIEATAKRLLELPWKLALAEFRDMPHRERVAVIEALRCR